MLTEVENQSPAAVSLTGSQRLETRARASSREREPTRAGARCWPLSFPEASPPKRQDPRDHTPSRKPGKALPSRGITRKSVLCPKVMLPLQKLGSSRNSTLLTSKCLWTTICLSHLITSCSQGQLSTIIDALLLLIRLIVSSVNKIFFAHFNCVQRRAFCSFPLFSFFPHRVLCTEFTLVPEVWKK